MSTLELKELSHPSGEVIKIAAGKTLDLKSQGTTTLPTGSVLQVVSATSVTGTATTSTTYVATGVTATITPSATTSKILILVNGSAYLQNNNFVVLTIKRGTTDLADGRTYGLAASRLRGGTDLGFQVGMSYVDSPATTSATVYEVFLRGTAGTVEFPAPSGDPSACHITLTEIQG